MHNTDSPGGVAATSAPGHTVTPAPLVASAPSRYSAVLLAEYVNASKCQRLVVQAMGTER